MAVKSSLSNFQLHFIWLINKTWWNGILNGARNRCCRLAIAIKSPVYCVCIFVFLLAFISLWMYQNWFYVAGFCIAWLGLVMLNGFLCMCFEHKVNTGNDLWVYCCTFGIVVVRSISNEQTIKFIKNSFMLRNDIHILNAMYFITFSYFSFGFGCGGIFPENLTSKLK